MNSWSRMVARRARARHYARCDGGAAQAQVAREVSPPRPHARQGCPDAMAFHLWRQPAHLCLWTWLTATAAIWCLPADYLFQWGSVMPVNCFKVWDNNGGLVCHTVSSGNLEYVFTEGFHFTAIRTGRLSMLTEIVDINQVILLIQNETSSKILQKKFNWKLLKTCPTGRAACWYYEVCWYMLPDSPDLSSFRCPGVLWKRVCESVREKQFLRMNAYDCLWWIPN